MEVQIPGYRITPKIKLDPRSTALVVGDMQFDFVNPKGTLCVPEARKTLGAIRHLISLARAAKCSIIFTLDWHRPDDPEFAIWPPHTVEGTRGAQIVAQLKPIKSDYFIRKRTYDAFFGTDLDLILRQKGIRTLVFTGTVANICVLHMAGSAYLRGYNVLVPEDAISSLNPFDQALALRQISFVYQGKVTSSSGITFQKR